MKSIKKLVSHHPTIQLEVKFKGPQPVGFFYFFIFFFGLEEEEKKMALDRLNNRNALLTIKLT